MPMSHIWYSHNTASSTFFQHHVSKSTKHCLLLWPFSLSCRATVRGHWHRTQEQTSIDFVCCFAGTGTGEAQTATSQTLRQAQVGSAAPGSPVATWQAYESEGITISHRAPVSYLTWHAKGDYFASVAPTGEHLTAPLCASQSVRWNRQCQSCLFAAVTSAAVAAAHCMAALTQQPLLLLQPACVHADAGCFPALYCPVPRNCHATPLSAVTWLGRTLCASACTCVYVSMYWFM
jgi:hypothetical protein